MSKVAWSDEIAGVQPRIDGLAGDEIRRLSDRA
jgi:hypothetical protein